MNEWNFQFPDDLVPFERLTDKHRAIFVERVSEQFTVAAAHELYDLGLTEEKTSAAVSVPITQASEPRMKVELVSSALADWQTFSRSMAHALEAAVVVLGADSNYGSCIVPLLRNDGFLFRHGYLRIVFR